MSWHGAIQRAQRAQERERKRLLALQKEAEEMDALARARHEVEVHENLIAILLSVHKQCSDPVNWETLANQSAPELPTQKTANELTAQSALANYKPSFFDRVFGRTERKRIAL